MRKMDEMDRDIQLRSIQWGYRVAMFSLAIWTFYNCYQSLVNEQTIQPLPSIILCISASVQSFVQLGLKQKMVKGDEEYKEPNKILRAILLVIVIFAIVMFVGTYIVLKV